MKQKICVLLLFVLIASSVSSCQFFDRNEEPMWNAFCEQLAKHYVMLEKIEKSTNRSPSMFFYLTGTFTKEQHLAISKDIVMFVVSEEGYPEMQAFYQQQGGLSVGGFSEISIFINDSAVSGRRLNVDVSFVQDATISETDLTNLRGFYYGVYTNGDTGEQEDIYLLAQAPNAAA